MSKNIMVLMFPEYNDKSNPSTSKDWTTDELYDDKTIGKQLKDAGIFIDFFKDEECLIVYDSKNIHAYWFVVDTLPECYPSRTKQLITVLKGLQDWRKDRVSSESEEYSLHYNTVKDEIRTEIASRQNSYPEDSCIIATNIFGKECKSWELKKDNASFTVESVPMFIPDVFDWLSKRHKPLRVYERNEKHGENGKGAHPENKGDKVSVLECSITHAKELLPIAIGEPMYDFLYCFDAKIGKYMEFPAGCKFKNLPEGAQERKYHSYHIDNENQVPNRVLKKLRILHNQSE